MRHGFKPSTRGKGIPVYKAMDWLKKETDFIGQVNKKLGLGTFEPSAPRTRENTGSCPVCFQNIKIPGGRITKHGYKRPGDGSIYGSCHGVGFQPYEVSSEGCKDYLDKVDYKVKSTRAYIARLNQGEVTSLVIDHKKVDNTDKHWDYYLERAIKAEEWTLKGLLDTTDAYSKLVQHWKERPLPKEGEMHIDWYFKGQRP